MKRKIKVTSRHCVTATRSENKQSNILIGQEIIRKRRVIQVSPGARKDI